MGGCHTGLRYTLASFGQPSGPDSILAYPGGMMPEILTESFCERCGTRYTFESTAPRKTRRLGQFKTLGKGMKNWVMSDDTSLDEAMAAARNDDDRALTSHQLDAFHATFNFCMTCRQYTCGNCWNAAEGRCLTCAPHLGQEILPAPFPDQAAFEAVRIEAESWPEVDLSVAEAEIAANGNGHGRDIEPQAESVDPWASTGATDVEEMPDFDPAARLAFLSGETPLPVVEPEPPAAMVADAPEGALPEVDEPAIAAAAEQELAEVDDAVAGAGMDEVDLAAAFQATADIEKPAEVEAVADLEATAEVETIAATSHSPVARAVVEPLLPATVEGKADVGAARTADLLRRFRPGQNIDDELAAYEASIEDASEPVAAAAELPPEAELVAAVAPEPEAESVAAAAELVEAPSSEPAAEPVAAEAAEASVEPTPVQPTPAPLPALTWRTPTAPIADEAPAPTPIAAEAPAPAPIAAEAPAPAPIAAEAPAPEPIAAEPPRDDRIQQPTWQIFAPDATPAVGPLDGSVPPVAPVQPPAAPVQPPFAASADPQWPVRPDQTESPAMALLANRANRSPSEGLWAASAQEVLATPANAPAPTSGVQPCSSCGLSLSATARFCRRCGTRQG
jgi:ribosomal protein L40E